MIVQVKVNSWSLKKIAQEKYSLLRKAFPDLNEEQKENYRDIEAAVDLEEFLAFDIEPSNVEIKPVARLSLPEDKFQDLRKAKTAKEISSAVTTVNVTLPGYELPLYTHVDWREDCCTQEIQDLLKDGWRILAILPQPNQRRPDYILGRK